MNMQRSREKKVLLHVCCAPCTTHVVQELESSFTVRAYFFNPNIHPEKEYYLRLSEFRRYASLTGIEIIEGKYDTKDWFAAVEGYEGEPEGGERCRLCYLHRIRKTAVLAGKMRYDFFATTLTTGPTKKADVINEIGRAAGEECGVEFLCADFKKRGGFEKSCELSKQFALYRQNYCGCTFSKRSEV